MRTIAGCVLGAGLALLVLATACGGEEGKPDVEDVSVTPTRTVEAPSSSSNEPTDTPDLGYGLELLDIVEAMTAFNKTILVEHTAYAACSTEASCFAAGNDLVDALSLSRPALADLVQRTKVLSEGSNETYDGFTSDLLSVFNLRLEALDELVQGWETGDEALFSSGGRKFDESQALYLETIKRLVEPN